MRVDRDLTVIIPFSGSYQYLRLCLAGLRYQTLHPSHIIFVHDNCEVRPAGDYHCNIQNISHVIYKGDKGNRSAVRNMGITAATTEYVLLMDEDIIFLSNYFENLQVAVEGITPDRVIHGSLINKRVDIEQELPQVMEAVNTAGQVKAATSAIGSPSTIPVTRWQSFCTGNLTVSKALLHSAGLFDENITGWGEEDTEMGFRVYKAGGTFFNIMSTRGVHIVKPSISTRERNRNWHKNLLYTLGKHKGEPEYVKARQRCLSFSRRYQ